MKRLIILLSIVTSLSCSAQNFDRNNTTNVLNKKNQEALQKHRAQQAQQQQQQVTQQRTQQRAQQTVNQTQQAAIQMANTNYTQNLRQTSSVRPTNANGVRTLSKVGTKSIYGGANGNITTSIDTTTENDNPTTQETTDSTSTPQTFNQQGGAGFNVEGTHYASYNEHIIDFKSRAQSENQRTKRTPPSNPNISQNPTPKPPQPNPKPVPPITEADRQKAYDKIEKNIPDRYLRVGEIGDAKQAHDTWNYLTWTAQDPAKPGYVSYCVQHLVGRSYVVVRGEMIKGQCKYTPISKPRQDPIQTIVKSKTSQPGKGNKQNKAPKDTSAPKTAKPSKKF